MEPGQENLLTEGTPAERKAMELLVALGDIYGADGLIEVTSVHVSGASYKIIGEAGLEFLAEFSKTARAKVRTTVNPLGMDLRAWREIGIPEEFASKQVRIAEAYKRRGIEETWSCIPYQVGNRPEVGEHLAWAESSAVIFANSILGARTNREGGPSALASAITGWTPNYGLHLEENRRATARVEVMTPVKGYEYSLLGHHLGKRLGSGVPLIEGLKGSEDELKALGASLATSSDINMFHVEGLTPEWEMVDSHGLK
ncbi:MAG: aconitase X catalytic domain-containing protein, partial [Candidatus Thermoplasmatota archaeon]|nr:aconitase X catalytic domain-containing protein [Candidatus Thermoplasmatota archaeon]